MTVEDAARRYVRAAHDARNNGGSRGRLVARLEYDVAFHELLLACLDDGEACWLCDTGTCPGVEPVMETQQ